MRTARYFITLWFLIGFVPTSDAQTREQGPWWPHPIWGKDDQAGGSN